MKAYLKSFLRISGYLSLVLKAFFLALSNLGLIMAISATLSACKNTATTYELSSSVFMLRVIVNEPEVHVILQEKKMPLRLSEGNYIYRAQVSGSRDTIFTLQDPSVTVSGQNLTIRGKKPQEMQTVCCRRLRYFQL